MGFLKNFDDEHENDYEHEHVLNFAHGIPIPQNSAKALILLKKFRLPWNYKTYSTYMDILQTKYKSSYHHV